MTRTTEREKMSAHTPGPWEVRPSSNPKNGTGWRDIVSMGTEFNPSYVGEALEQDARLIAAAPEMLAAMKELYRILLEDEGYKAYNPKMQQARAAIAKAEAK